MLLNLGFIFIGVTLVLWGADKLTDGSVAIAQKMRVSQVIIGLTVVAMGTSMPEFSVSLVSALKGTSDLAIGNVIGSNIFNILAILGVTGLIHPMLLQGITMFDLSIMVISMILIWFLSFTKYTIERWEGFCLIVVFIGYMVKLLVSI